jgi:hypothetical protein
MESVRNGSAIARGAARLVLSLVLLLAAGPSPAAAAEDHWVVATRPVAYCGGPATQLQPDEAKALLLSWLGDGEIDDDIAQSCGLLPVGEKFLLDDKQTEAERQEAVLLWHANCTSGCSPFMSPFYAPSRKLVGAYLEPTSPPKGF